MSHRALGQQFSAEPQLSNPHSSGVDSYGRPLSSPIPGSPVIKPYQYVDDTHEHRYDPLPNSRYAVYMGNGVWSQPHVDQYGNHETDW